jgi:hypothetical protein
MQVYVDAEDNCRYTYFFPVSTMGQLMFSKLIDVRLGIGQAKCHNEMPHISGELGRLVK